MMPASLEEYLGVEGDVVEVVDHGPEPQVDWERFAAASRGWLKVRHAPGPEPREVTLSGQRPHGRIVLLGDVEQRQLAPLAETLRALATGEVDADTPATAGLLEELSSERTLAVVVSPTCPYCPSVAAAAMRLALLCPRVSVTILRADQVEVPASVKAVPSMLVDGALLSSGPIGEYALAELVLKAG